MLHRSGQLRKLPSTYSYIDTQGHMYLHTYVQLREVVHSNKNMHTLTHIYTHTLTIGATHLPI